MDIEKFRNYFPYIKTGKIYFAHASTAPLSTPVVNTINEFLALRSEGKIDDYHSFLRVLTSAKGMLGEMINCAPERIAFMDNTVNAVSVLANGIQWNKGDRILLNDLEFPANVYPFINLQKQGVVIDYVKSHDGIVSAEDIIEAVKPGTRLISVSSVQFLTGYRIDLLKLGKFCKENNIIFSVDAIQGLGAFTFDVQECNIDFVASGTQKWMMGLQGLSFIYLTEGLQKQMSPGQVGWLSVEDAWNLLHYDLKLKSTAEAFETGTLNSIGIYALYAALNVFKEAGYENISKQVLDNTEYFMQQLLSIGITPFLVDVPRENLSGIVSFKHDKAGNIFKGLLAKDVISSLREGIIRFAPHFYNNREDIDKVVSFLKEMPYIK